MKRAIYLMSCEQVLGHWEEDVLPLLRRIPHYFESQQPQYVLERMLKGTLQVWALADDEVHAIILTEVKHLPEEKVFRFVGCSGMELDEFVPMFEDTFDKTATVMGCKRMEMVANRRGWMRKLKQFRSKFEFRYEILSRRVLQPKEM